MKRHSVRLLKPASTLLLTGIAVALGIAPAPAQPTALFTDDFESGLSKWTQGAVPFSISTFTNKVGAANSVLCTNSGCFMNVNSSIAITDTTDSCRFSFWLYDWGTNNNLRPFATVRNYSGGSYGSGTLNQLVAIGTYNSVTLTPYNANKFCGRMAFGTPSGWFCLTNAPDRTVGWHHLAIERGLNSASKTVYKFYVDDILGMAYTNSGSVAAWNAVTAGLGTAGVTGSAYFDGFELVQGQAFISEEPRNSTNVIGDTATFSVLASGSADTLSYWWFKNGVPLSDDSHVSGANYSTLYLFNVQTSDVGLYSVMVSNVWGARTSAIPARLEVAGIGITVQPISQVVNLGSNNVSFYIESIGVGNLTYQWQKDGVKIAGATANGSSSTFTIPEVGVSDLGVYTCLVTNDQNAILLSAPATLSSNGPPVALAAANLATNLSTHININVSGTLTDDFSSIGLFGTFDTNAAGSAVMFQAPAYSGSTAKYVDAGTSRAYVTNANIPPGNIRSGTSAYYITVNFTNTDAIGWDRLTSVGFNPTVSFGGPLKFDIWSDRPLGITVGLSESSSTAALGANGGTSSNIENAGVTNNGSIPAFLYAAPARAWTNVTYDLADTLWPADPNTGFAGWAATYIKGANLVGGNGVLESTTGKGVIENLGLSPADGLGVYNIYVDNFQSLGSNWLRFSLDAPSPSDATIDPFSGVIDWTTPATAGTTKFVVRATDHLGLYRTNSFTVTVPAAPPAEPLKYAVLNNQLVLSWTNASFSLQSSGSVSGGFTNITGAVSPYTNDLSGVTRFFRLHWQQP